MRGQLASSQCWIIWIIRHNPLTQRGKKRVIQMIQHCNDTKQRVNPILTGGSMSRFERGMLWSRSTSTGSPYVSSTRVSFGLVQVDASPMPTCIALSPTHVDMVGTSWKKTDPQGAARRPVISERIQRVRSDITQTHGAWGASAMRQPSHSTSLLFKPHCERPSQGEMKWLSSISILL